MVHVQAILNPCATILNLFNPRVEGAIKFRNDCNMVFNTHIPLQFANNGYGDIFRFLQSHILYRAMSKDASSIKYNTLMEFWGTCNVQGNAIVGQVMVNEEVHELRFTAADLRRVLELPSLEEFDEETAPEEASEAVKQAMGYTYGARQRKFQAPCVQGIWKFLLYSVTRCLGCKLSSFDQANDMEVQIMHSMMFGRDLDYVEMMFSQLRANVTRTPRSSTVLYPRFLCLLIEEKLGMDVYLSLPGE